MEIKLYFTILLCSVYLSAAHCKKTFNYTINNQLVDPYFNNCIQLDIVNSKPLIYYMEEACLQDSERFPNFTATFHPSFNGYFINAINGLWGNWLVNRTWWAIYNSTGLIPFGVSQYVPIADDPILFNFYQSSTEH